MAKVTIDPRTRARLRREIRAELYEEVKQEVETEVRSALEREVREEVTAKVRDEQSSGPVTRSAIEAADVFLHDFELDAQARAVAALREAEMHGDVLQSSKRARERGLVVLYASGIPLVLAFSVLSSVFSVAFLLSLYLWYQGVKAVARWNSEHATHLTRRIDQALGTTKNYRNLANAVKAARVDIATVENQADLKARLRAVTKRKTQLDGRGNAGVHGFDEARAAVRDRMLGETDIDRILALSPIPPSMQARFDEVDYRAEDEPEAATAHRQA